MSPRGLSCPHCGSPCLRVCRLFRPCPGKLVRTRECRSCGRRWMTEERFRLPHTTPQK